MTTKTKTAPNVTTKSLSANLTVATYGLALTVKAEGTVDEIAKRAWAIFWPDEDNQYFQGYNDHSPRTADGGAVLLVTRELRDDMTALEEAEDETGTLTEALCYLAQSELDAIATKLDAAGVKAISVEIDWDSMSSEDKDVLDKLQDRWRRHLDDRAYARVKARRGEPVEGWWSPVVVGAYLTEAKLCLDRLVKDIDNASDSLPLSLRATDPPARHAYETFVKTLKATVKYAETVFDANKKG